MTLEATALFIGHNETPLIHTFETSSVQSKIAHQPSCPSTKAAAKHWKLLSEQICEVVGSDVHNQWFANIKPIIVSNDVLVLQTANTFSCQWINSHYQDLVDLLLSFQNTKLTTFFISPEDRKKLDETGRWY